MGTCTGFQAKEGQALASIMKASPQPLSGKLDHGQEREQGARYDPHLQVKIWRLKNIFQNSDHTTTIPDI